jgi:hypothetical protein
VPCWPLDRESQSRPWCCARPLSREINCQLLLHQYETYYSYELLRVWWYRRVSRRGHTLVMSNKANHVQHLQHPLITAPSESYTYLGKTIQGMCVTECCLQILYARVYCQLYIYIHIVLCIW